MFKLEDIYIAAEEEGLGYQCILHTEIDKVSTEIYHSSSHKSYQ